jgi:hypothetical protein
MSCVGDVDMGCMPMPSQLRLRACDPGVPAVPPALDAEQGDACCSWLGRGPGWGVLGPPPQPPPPTLLLLPAVCELLALGAGSAAGPSPEPEPVRPPGSCACLGAPALCPASAAWGCAAAGRADMAGTDTGEPSTPACSSPLKMLSKFASSVLSSSVAF